MSDHQPETAQVAEVRALSARARESARFYAHASGPSGAFKALADDLDALAVAMSTPPGNTVQS